MYEKESGRGPAAHVNGYLAAAKASIDEQFGPGFAAANPALVVAFIGACSSDALTVVLRDNIGGGLGEVGAGLQSVGTGLITGNFGG